MLQTFAMERSARARPHGVMLTTCRKNFLIVWPNTDIRAAFFSDP